MIRILFRNLIREILFTLHLKKRYRIIVAVDPGRDSEHTSVVLCKVMASGEMFWHTLPKE